MADPIFAPQTFDTEQLAVSLGIRPRTIRDRVRRGEFPAPIKNGRLTRWLVSDIKLFIECGLDYAEYQRRKAGSV